MALSARSEPPKSKPDAIIVLGAGFWGDTLSAVLKERLDTAFLLHRRYPSALLVLSGGKGFGENRTEASLMREYLLARGVPDSALLLETQAMDTVQNFENSSRLLDARFGEGGYTGAFITSEFHLYRSRRLAVRAGLTAACYGADTPLVSAARLPDAGDGRHPARSAYLGGYHGICAPSPAYRVQPAGRRVPHQSSSQACQGAWYDATAP